MNPYIPMFMHPTDQAITWLFSLLWVLIGAVSLRWRFSGVLRSEGWFLSAIVAFCGLSVAIFVVFTIGLIFLIWLRIVSSFWFFYVVIQALSVVALFWVFPVFVAIFSLWLLFGKSRAKYSKRSVVFYWRCLFICAVDVLLYYATLISAAYQVK